MSIHLLIYFIIAVAAVAVPTYIRVVRSPAYRQKRDQVVMREPGQRRLGAPRDAAEDAREDLEFALLSQAAYQRTTNARQVKAGEALNPDNTLESMGWCRWKNFPDGEVKQKVDRVHLRVEVWSNSSARKIAVTFGGTVARNIKDWISDLRWFIPYHKDEYSEIVDTFGDAFVKAYEDRASQTNCEFPDHPRLFSTGHSLGRGLAQEFAYSLPLTPNVPRVTKVFAFDPSPVTGFRSVEKGIRDNNKACLDIDRIYERREILAYFRSLTNFVAPPSASHPTIRQLRYNLLDTRNPFAGHSIAQFALKLYEVSQHKPGS